MLITVCSHIYPFQRANVCHHPPSSGGTALALRWTQDSRCWSLYQLDVMPLGDKQGDKQTHTHNHIFTYIHSHGHLELGLTSSPHSHIFGLLVQAGVPGENSDTRRAHTLNTQRPGSELNSGPSSCVATTLATALWWSLLWPPNYPKSMQMYVTIKREESGEKW